MGLAGPLAGRRFVVSDSLTIGRGPDADVSINGESVSRRHAMVFRTPAGEFMIEDLGSRNGTLVNGTRASLHVLRFGDKIQIGEHALLAFTEHSEAEEQIARWQKLQFVGQLAAGVVHDLRNCMQVVLGNAGLMRRLLARLEDDRDGLLQCLEDVEAAAKHGASLTQQVLGFARSGRGLALIDMAGLLAETVAMMRRGVPAHTELRCATDQLAARDLVVLGDRTELLQVFINLIANASDALPRGGVVAIDAELRTLSLEERERVNVGAAGRAVVVHVEDDGVGMSGETSARAFEALFTTKQPGKGTGLGLVTVQRIVRDHGGDVRIASVPGEGTRVTVILPSGGGSASAETDGIEVVRRSPGGARD